MGESWAGGRIELVVGDITRLDVSAIVNAANEGLAPGGGVCGAIHRSAGPELAVACRSAGPCPTGDARITPGFDLIARHVIHAVGPVWQGGSSGEPELLAGCYRAALDLALEAGAASLAFPAISTGIYGYPLDLATGIAVTTVSDFVAAHEIPARVVFCCFSPEDADAYREELDAKFEEPG